MIHNRGLILAIFMEANVTTSQFPVFNVAIKLYGEKLIEDIYIYKILKTSFMFLGTTSLLL